MLNIVDFEIKLIYVFLNGVNSSFTTKHARSVKLRGRICAKPIKLESIRPRLYDNANILPD
jgi:hypothetical protein